MVDKVVNILDMMELIGEDGVKQILSDFSCPLNMEIENFVHNNAIDFAKRKMSVTFLVFNENGMLSGIFALTHKAIEISAEGMSGAARKKLGRYAYLDEQSQSYTVSAFLIGQFGKNYKDGVDYGIDGNALMNSAISKLISVQHEVGGGVVYLDCEEKEPLIQFYSSDNNRFKRCGEHISKVDNTKYVRMIRLF